MVLVGSTNLSMAQDPFTKYKGPEDGIMSVQLSQRRSQHHRDWTWDLDFEFSRRWKAEVQLQS